MTGPSNPWARPSGSDESFGGWVPPPQRPATPPAKPSPPPAGGRGVLLPFAIAGGAVFVVGLVVVLILASTGFFSSEHRSLFNPSGNGPQPSLPPLAKLCPPVSTEPDPGGKVLGPIEGPRLIDADSGISYLRLQDPWVPWNRAWSGGTLNVTFGVGYYFVTEQYSGGDYLASVLSGQVPATVGDSLTLNLECAGRQVAEDVRREYYPRPNVKEKVRDERVVVGGRPAWVSTFHLTFQAAGLEARGEQVAVVLVDVGRPAAAVLYISIPDTHKQWNVQIDKIIASIQPA